MSKLHQIAVAAALAVTGASASATIIGSGFDLPPERSNDNTELLLVIYSRGVQESYVQDLGVTIGDMKTLGSSAAGWSFSADATDYFTNSHLPTAADAKWAVLAFDTLQDASILDSQMLTTLGAGSPDVTAPGRSGFTGDDMNSAGTNAWANTTAILSYNYGTHPTQANGSSLTKPEDGWAYWLAPGAPLENWNGNFDYTYGNSFGVASAMYHYAAQDMFDLSIDAKATPFGNSQHLGSWLFDGTTVSYTLAAAVPEPSSVALMFAGLGVVGLLAKRRARR